MTEETKSAEEVVVAPEADDTRNVSPPESEKPTPKAMNPRGEQPQIDLAPPTALVSVVGAALARNTVAVMLRELDKPFLVLRVLGEVLRRPSANALLAVARQDQVSLWRDTVQLSLEADKAAAVTVATHKELKDMDNETQFDHIVIDNGQLFLGTDIVGQLQASQSKARWTVLTTHLLTAIPSRQPHLIDRLFLDLRTTFPNCEINTSCDLVTAARHATKPSYKMVTYEPTESVEYNSLEGKMRQELEAFQCFLESHVHSLEEIYGEEFADEISDIPDPAEIPLRLFRDVRRVLDEFGPYPAQRAALLLLISLERLKTTEKYERAFILLEASFTVLSKVCKFWIEEVQATGLSESDLIHRYTKPKLLRFADFLLTYKPEHVGNYKARKSNGKIANYEDKHQLAGLVFLDHGFQAKIVYHFLKDLSRCDDRFSFLMPQCCFADEEGKTSTDHARLKRKREDSLKRFRLKEGNIMVTNSNLEEGIDQVRCNLVVCFDPPSDFASFCLQKNKARGKKAKVVFLCDNSGQSEVVLKTLSQFSVLERRLIDHSDQNDRSCAVTSSQEKNAVIQVNRYCAKLPSDAFTRLHPVFQVHQRKVDNLDYFVCVIQLPINSPVRETVIGQVQRTEAKAKGSAALELLSKLQQCSEIETSTNPRKPVARNTDGIDEYYHQRHLGATKRRQYYYKQVASTLNSNSSRGSYTLYSLSLVLTCPLPEDQNTRGRRLHPPENAAQSFGILVSNEMPPICSFPIYTRSGEVLVSLDLVQNDVVLEESQRANALSFHRFTFSQVLRLEKYPMEFDPDSSDNSVLVLPLKRRDKAIDWAFVADIASQGNEKLGENDKLNHRDFVFNERNYDDAVVMPWYRSQDQPQYFYVAEICRHLSPKSEFPADGYASFEEYYKAKYHITIYSADQPLLDVDHTSARLNFLTPRYVNRKGVSLPSSSEETKRSKRENLDQKQILVPELCTIHPFPASLWRQAVSLPCIFYRINSLLIANQLRTLIAREMRIGVDPALTGDWPPLDFGWTLSEVLRGRERLENESTRIAAKKARRKMPKSTRLNLEDELNGLSDGDEGEDENDVDSLSTTLAKKINLEDQKSKLKSMEIGTWSNEMAESIPTEFDEDEDDLLDPTMALPDNLIVLDAMPKKGRSMTMNPEAKSARDWGTGIEQKPCRVASPNFLNIPGNMSEDDEDDDAIDSCDSDVDLSDEFDEEAPTKKKKKESEDIEENGRMKFKFASDNSAEAVEDEAEIAKRVKELEQDREDEKIMLASIPWKELGENIEPNEAFDSDMIRERDELSTRFRNDSHAVNEESKNSEEQIDLPEADELKSWVGEIKQNLNHIPIFMHDTVLKSSTPSTELNSTEEKGLSFKPEIFSFSFDAGNDKVRLGTLKGPSPSLILQALTMSNSNDAINLERLETIGDSFLKYAITSYLFSMNENVHEGRLSNMRSKQVSNVHLYQLGKLKRLGEAMVASKFEPHDNWLPPCYHVPKNLEQQALIESGVDKTPPPTEEEKPITTKDTKQHFVPYNLLTQHSIPDKSIADCAEALIGAYLLSTGERGALLFMSWLGLNVLPREDTEEYGDLPEPTPPLNDRDRLVDPRAMSFLTCDHSEFESIIGYKFRDRGYLIQALTHTSYHANRLTDCYQRLEFLGDAVLDYLITRYLFEDDRKHSPGELTDLRSSLVNNTIFASLAVKYGFHRHFRHFSPGLHRVVARFVRFQMHNNHQISEDYAYFLPGSPADELEDIGHNFLVVEEAEDVEVPKALGDLFESVAGAVFVDSGRSLDAVWQVYFRMMKDDIERFSQNVPKSPIRELLELEPETAKFGKPEKLSDGKRVRITVEVFGKGKFRGVGRNYRIAKTTAAKCALRGILNGKKK